MNQEVAIITGSSNGIGKEVAAQLLRKGYAVVINGRNQERLENTKLELKAFGEDILAVAGSVANKADAESIVVKTINHYGRIDVLINNAGVSLKSKLEETEPDVFKQVFETNVFGSTNTTTYALPHLKKNKGSIVFISSVAGIRGLPNASAYCASKMALRGIAESLRVEEAESGIHVGLIYVGFTKNDPNKTTLTAKGKLEPINNNKGFKLQTPEYVASKIIANFEKRRFITTLSSLGRLNKIMQSLSPSLVEKIIIKRSK